MQLLSMRLICKPCRGYLEKGEEDMRGGGAEEDECKEGGDPPVEHGQPDAAHCLLQKHDISP